MTGMLIALVAAAAAYTLEPFTVEHNTLERTNVTKTKAAAARTTPRIVHWVPQATDDTSEAYHASRTFANDRKASLEFVHVHKCGGMTFNRVAPRFVCGTSACRNSTCCVVRPHNPSLYELEYRPRYGAAFEELDAYRLPWSTPHVHKAAMAREPFRGIGARSASSVPTSTREGRRPTAKPYVYPTGDGTRNATASAKV